MVLIKITDKSADPAFPPEEALRLQLHKLVQHFERLVADESLAGGLWKGKEKDKGKGRHRSSLRRQKRLAWPWPWPWRRGRARRSSSVTDDALAAAVLEPLLEPQADAPALEDLQSDHLALILDGPALACILGDAEMERLLLRVATLCKSVVACRVSPAQKRELVRCVLLEGERGVGWGGAETHCVCLILCFF
jgi:hypothetical protein